MRKRPTVTLFFLLVLCVSSADTAQKPQGQRSDGSRAVPVHLIPLYANDPVDQEKVLEITPDDELLLPFSIQRTCSECHIYKHDYETIDKGWHFNALDPNVSPGRPGEPWILADASIATQIPLSYRPWAGTFRPEQLGITPFRFAQLFGRHMPGGGVGEYESKRFDEIARQIVSGKLEINCLICHDADPAYDLAEYAGQITGQNFRWAATGACGFASVAGSAAKMPDTYDYSMPDMLDDPELMPLRPTVTYRKDAFDHKNQVFFDVVREVPNERCYFCHSSVNLTGEGAQKWVADEDVHLTAGMTCVDCHREGPGHNTIRGYEGEVSTNRLAAETSCKGCHLGRESSSEPIAGRLGAPVPKHPGIPPIHFEKLTCTACHSGPWPTAKTYRGKTSRAHALGTHNVNRSPGVLPHIIYPVFAKQGDIGVAEEDEFFFFSLDGKIGPHKLIWPAFWGALKKDEVTPIALETVSKTVGKIIPKEKLSSSGDWPSLTEEYITRALTSLAKSVKGQPVYICGGKLYRLDDSGVVRTDEGHPAAQPYLWPIAHNVRPAAQSLGVRHCQDCHATDAPFFFGQVAVDSVLESDRDSVKKMVEFQDIDAFYAWAFAFSFVFRPWLKVVALGSCAILAGVLLLYALKALACVARVLVGKEVRKI